MIPKILLVGLTGLLDLLRNVEAVVVVGNLVSQLARSGHLDATSPVGVDVAETVGEVLNHLLCQVLRLIGVDKVVDRHDATLSSLLRNQEEVELGTAFFILNETRIEDGSWLWVLKSFGVANKHSLVDPLVDDDKSELRFVSGLVVDLLADVPHLADLLTNNVLLHAFTDSIAENHNLLGEASDVGSELLESSGHTGIKLSLDDLLILGLDDEVAEVGGASLVGGGSKADNR